MYKINFSVCHTFHRVHSYYILSLGKVHKYYTLILYVTTSSQGQDKAQGWFNIEICM